MEWSLSLFLFLVFFVFVGYIIYVLLQHDVDVYTYSQFVVHQTAIKLVYRVIRYHKQGQLHIPEALVYTAGGGDDSNCSLVISPKKHNIIFTGLRIDQTNLKQYKSLCGDKSPAGEVPVCFAETLFLKPLLALITSSKFCLSPLGLIHVRQTIKQWFPLQDYISSAFKAEVSVVEYRKLTRGVEVDVSMRLLASGNFCIWEGVATVLSRAKDAPKSSRKQKAAELPYSDSFRVSVPGKCGVEYARLTGDWNPHHLYPWSARLLGYRCQIAHGMWTLSRAMSQLYITGAELSEAVVEVSCSFKTPVYMPGDVIVKLDGLTTAHHNTGCRVAVENPQTGAPHVVANVKLI